MKVETKYNVNDELWFIIAGRAECRKVYKIKITVEGTAEYKTGAKRNLIKTGNYGVKDIEVGYIMESSSGPLTYYVDPIEEKRLFKTKKELIASL